MRLLDFDALRIDTSAEITRLATRKDLASFLPGRCERPRTPLLRQLNIPHRTLVQSSFDLGATCGEEACGPKEIFPGQ